ncbi:hypothetical protein PAHA111176_05870 [Parendozoicomonas haliclonae]|uniref:Uncharacterized protein n=1 Tax=Parendozoicomonas haliclonae TaxID=1960125 RepID=A0A1X7AKB7_9GAMM|nr:hypothetical protein EHSB41UT_02537 [Parendozoicomonas haliclonae]
MNSVNVLPSDAMLGRQYLSAHLPFQPVTGNLSTGKEHSGGRAESVPTPTTFRHHNKTNEPQGE